MRGYGRCRPWAGQLRASAVRALAKGALTREECELAVEKLGRQSTRVELGIIAALGSEQCRYETSKRLPVTGERVLQGPGENAGEGDVGNAANPVTASM